MPRSSFDPVPFITLTDKVSPRIKKWHQFNAVARIIGSPLGHPLALPAAAVFGYIHIEYRAGLVSEVLETHHDGRVTDLMESTK